MIATKALPIYYNGDTIERGGYKFTVNFPLDELEGKPWEDGDGQGIVDFQVSRPKKPGERILFKDGRNYSTFFDWQGTIKKANEENWSISADRLDEWAARIGRRPTRRMVAEAAVEDNFQWMRRWMLEEWEYVGIQITYQRGRNDKVVVVFWGYTTDDRESLSREVERHLDQIVDEVERQTAVLEEEACTEDEKKRNATAALLTIRQAILWSHFTDAYKLDLHLALSALAERARLPYPPE